MDLLTSARDGRRPAEPSENGLHPQGSSLLHVEVSPHDGEALIARPRGTAAADATAGLPTRPTTAAQRAFDLAIALAVLPCGLVVGALRPAAVYIGSPGPIFRGGARVGRGGRVFHVLKF